MTTAQSENRSSKTRSNRAAYERRASGKPKTGGGETSRKKLKLVLNGTITLLFYLTFPVFAALLFYIREPKALAFVLTCGISFALVTVARHFINAPRPYEKDPSIPAPVQNAKTGEAFPSRHVFAAFVIAVSVLRFKVLWGIILLICAVALAWLRKDLHYHDTLDVVVGAVVGVVSAVVGLWIF